MKFRSVFTAGLGMALALGLMVPAAAIAAVRPDTQVVKQIDGNANIQTITPLLASGPRAASSEVSGPQGSLDAASYGALTRATSLRDGIPTFDSASANLAGVPAEFVDEYTRGFTLAGGTVLGPAARIAMTPEENASVATTMASQYCNGRSQYWSDFWGHHWEITTCQANALAAVLAAGSVTEATIAGIAALTGVGIPVTALAIALSGVLGVGAAGIQLCNANNTGVTVHLTRVPWCGAQTP